MIKKSIMPNYLEDIIKKHEKRDIFEDYESYYSDLVNKDLYTDWLEKNHSSKNKYQKHIKPKKRLFKDTALGISADVDLEGNLRSRLSTRLPGGSYGGFTMGQLVGVTTGGPGATTGGVGVIVGFHRHHDFPYATDGSSYISKRETLEDDGAAIRADVLMGGVVHRVPLPNLFADVERGA